MHLTLRSLVACITICTAYHVTGQTFRSPISKAVARDVSYAITNLARDLSVNVASEHSKTDIISPLSIGSSMLLLLRTARGETRQELLRLLHLDKYQINNSTIPKNFNRLIFELLRDVTNETVLNDEPKWWGESKCISPEYEYDDEDEEDIPTVPPKPSLVKLANAIFVQNGMFNNSRLSKVVRKLYFSTVTDLDFANAPDAAKQYINQWANESTNGRIPTIIADQLSRDTSMVVANALYFKAYWEDVFLAGATKPRKFFPNGEDGESVEAEIMAHGGCFPYYSSQSLDASIMGFPYQNRKTSMYVILPNKSNRATLQQLIGKIDAATLDSLISNMTMMTATVLFPKMHISNTFELQSALRNLGISTVFSRGKSNFSLLNPGGANSPSVSDVLHKVDLEINESGTEGGAVTATLLDRAMPSVNFRVLTPFLIAIRHDVMKLLLFYGPVYDPSTLNKDE